MSQLTRRIRIYGGDCNQTAVVVSSLITTFTGRITQHFSLQLEAIKQTKVDLEVFLGNYVVAGDSSAYERQKKAIKEAIEVYGVTNIAGITVGNEYILKSVSFLLFDPSLLTPFRSSVMSRNTMRPAPTTKLLTLAPRPFWPTSGTRDRCLQA